MDQGRATPGGSGLAMAGRAGKAPKRPLMRLYGARNEKPRRWGPGLDGLGEVSLGLSCETSVMRILNDCSSRVNHPTTPKCSGLLVGETTRSKALNSDRGGGPLNAQRIVGKREPHTGNREMLPTPGEAPKGSKSNRTSFLGVSTPVNRPGSTTEGS